MFRLRTVALVAVLSLFAASCGGSPPPTTTTTTTTTPPPTTTTSTTTTTTTVPLIPNGPAMILEGDTNPTVAAFQFLLNCNGYATLTVSGVYDAPTRTAVETAQTALMRVADGGPDEATLAELSRTCVAVRPLEAAGYGELSLVGNAAPGDPATYSLPGLEGSLLTISTVGGAGITVLLHGIDGTIPDSPQTGSWSIDTTQDYIITVSSDLEPVTFEIQLVTAEAGAAVGEWVLSGDGIAFDGMKLALGDDADTVIEKVFEYLGHGIRGKYDEFDSGWYEIADPQVLGLRGLSVGGMKFLFFGPSSAEPTRDETLARIRFEGTTPDADGEPRPDHYVTTEAGISVGDTLTDLIAAYGDRAVSGSNSTEHYYRVSDSGGTLCFYFGTASPTDTSVISEMATECRTG